MTERDQLLQKMRPAIPSILPSEASKAERFQNVTLRPLLKGMNERLIEVFLHYARKRKGAFWKLAPEKQAGYIQHAVQQDSKLKQLILGLVISHLTSEEWAQYLQDEKELRRRIADLCIQRLQDQLDILRAAES